MCELEMIMLKVNDIVSITREGKYNGTIGIIKDINNIERIGVFYVVFFNINDPTASNDFTAEELQFIR